MTNPFPYADDNKRYHTWNYDLHRRFGKKVFKVSLNAGFTCPNIDGTKGTGGCTYCSGSGSGDFAGNPRDSLSVQFDAVRMQLHQKWPHASYIPYFQAHTNTYAPLSYLQQCYESVLSKPGVVGLAIATRADALPQDVVDYLAELSQRTYLLVELGLQTTFDQTAKHINRGHTYAEFLQGYQKLQDKGIQTCIHLINGLPFETRDMMLENISRVAQLHPNSVKIHLLHLLKGTKMAAEYQQNPFPLFSLDEYVSLVCDQLELLPASIVIQRLTGDGAKEDLIAPLWSLKKFVVLNEIDKELTRRNSWQGKYAQPPVQTLS